MVRFFSKFRIQSRMILVNSVPNLNSVAPKLLKLSHRKVSINEARTNNDNDDDTNPARVIVSLKWNFVETKISIFEPQRSYKRGSYKKIKACNRVEMDPLTILVHDARSRLHLPVGIS